jgi:hypothetical protein
VSTFQPRRDKLVRTEGLTRALALGASPHAYGVPVGLLASRTLMSQSPTGFSGRRVYCSAMSARKWSIHRDVRPARCLTKAVRRFLRVGCLKWSKRKDSHLRSPGGRRVYSALQLLLCHASESGGSSGIRTRGLLLMRELR